MAGCAKHGAPEPPDAGAPASTPPPAPSVAATSEPAVGDAEEDGGPAGAPGLSLPDASDDAGACPADMVHVRTRYCPSVERRCIDMEHEETNHLDICHAFAQEQRCRTPERDVAFCIDRYEYPNRRGAHPAWMVDWFQAQATCESRGKRLCWASEWTAACEGPEHTPFPYGWERDHDKCNMDNFYIDPIKPGPRAQFLFYSKDKDVAFKELSRLDQSMPSGSIETCRSGFGVYDLPGNVDEWVTSDSAPREKSKWAGLKGGAWGHVRSQCRPETFSHDPEFYYYFVGFRCCRDAADAKPDEIWTPSADAVPAPSVEPHDFAPEAVVPIDPPGPSKTKYARTGHRE
jgi:hypothetical protein